MDAKGLDTFETFFHLLAERSMASTQRRLITNLTMSAEERYKYFMEKYPLMIARTPQYAIASYVGMRNDHRVLVEDPQ